jgi:galactokinase
MATEIVIALLVSAATLLVALFGYLRSARQEYVGDLEKRIIYLEAENARCQEDLRLVKSQVFDLMGRLLQKPHLP